MLAMLFSSKKCAPDRVRSCGLLTEPFPDLVRVVPDPAGRLCTSGDRYPGIATGAGCSPEYRGKRRRRRPSTTVPGPRTSMPAIKGTSGPPATCGLPGDAGRSGARALRGASPQVSEANRATCPGSRATTVLKSAGHQANSGSGPCTCRRRFPYPLADRELVVNRGGGAGSPAKMAQCDPALRAVLALSGSVPVPSGPPHSDVAAG